MSVHKFMKGVTAMITAVGAVAVTTLAGCTRPLGDITKSARELVGKK